MKDQFDKVEQDGNDLQEVSGRTRGSLHRERQEERRGQRELIRENRSDRGRIPSNLLECRHEARRQGDNEERVLLWCGDLKCNRQMYEERR